eukprot:Rhum_TRINITY_DN979_c0_g1::Rhum_TRINITY_DN979_c0_g1_i1::g.2915::m.2915
MLLLFFFSFFQPIIFVFFFVCVVCSGLFGFLGAAFFLLAFFFLGGSGFRLSLCSCHQGCLESGHNGGSRRVRGSHHAKSVTEETPLRTFAARGRHSRPRQDQGTQGSQDQAHNILVLLVQQPFAESRHDIRGVEMVGVGGRSRTVEASVVKQQRSKAVAQRSAVRLPRPTKLAKKPAALVCRVPTTPRRRKAVARSLQAQQLLRPGSRRRAAVAAAVQHCRHGTQHSVAQHDLCSILSEQCLPQKVDDGEPPPACPPLQHSPARLHRNLIRSEHTRRRTLHSGAQLRERLVRQPGLLLGRLLPQLLHDACRVQAVVADVRPLHAGGHVGGGGGRDACGLLSERREGDRVLALELLHLVRHRRALHARGRSLLRVLREGCVAPLRLHLLQRLAVRGRRLALRRARSLLRKLRDAPALVRPRQPRRLGVLDDEAGDLVEKALVHAAGAVRMDEPLGRLVRVLPLVVRQPQHAAAVARQVHVEDVVPLLAAVRHLLRGACRGRLPSAGSVVTVLLHHVADLLPRGLRLVPAVHLDAAGLGLLHKQLLPVLLTRVLQLLGALDLGRVQPRQPPFAQLLARHRLLERLHQLEARDAVRAAREHDDGPVLAGGRHVAALNGRHGEDEARHRDRLRALAVAGPHLDRLVLGPRHELPRRQHRHGVHLVRVPVERAQRRRRGCGPQDQRRVVAARHKLGCRDAGDAAHPRAVPGVRGERLAAPRPPDQRVVAVCAARHRLAAVQGAAARNRRTMPLRLRNNVPVLPDDNHRVVPTRQHLARAQACNARHLVRVCVEHPHRRAVCEVPQRQVLVPPCRRKQCFVAHPHLLRRHHPPGVSKQRRQTLRFVLV